jgi:hypothetical protein
MARPERSEKTYTPGLSGSVYFNTSGSSVPASFDLSIISPSLTLGIAIFGPGISEAHIQKSQHDESGSLRRKDLRNVPCGAVQDESS